MTNDYRLSTAVVRVYRRLVPSPRSIRLPTSATEIHVSCGGATFKTFQSEKNRSFSSRLVNGS